MNKTQKYKRPSHDQRGCHGRPTDQTKQTDPGSPITMTPFHERGRFTVWRAPPKHTHTPENTTEVDKI